jgi:hypothetical protein
MFAKIENNNVMEFPIYNIREKVKNVSLPEDLTNPNNLPEGYVHVYESTFPEYDVQNEKVVLADKPIFKNNTWILEYIILPLIEQEKEEFIKQKSEDIRLMRNQLLSKCDWTQTKDVSDYISSNWIQYRQDLRDITAQPGFPLDVIWPIEPTQN